jgi:DNA-binding NtrC family response regulator
MAVILVVEDDVGVQDFLCKGLRQGGHEPLCFSTGEDALDRARRRSDLAIIDIKLPGMDGVATLRMARRIHPRLRAIACTAYPEYLDQTEALRAGFDAYVVKPVRLHVLLDQVERLLALESRAPEEGVTYSGTFDGMIGRSDRMRDVFRRIATVARLSQPVLVLGETGTGKELVARSIHAQSPRHRGPFVDVNCAAVPAPLLESEFFGHERGAFTDAKEARTGRFEEAHRGTLFLDEIGELPAELQAKLLRAVDQGEIRRLGSARPTAVDVRIVAATNVDLRRKMEGGWFRADLYWRLSAFVIALPPLGERGQDVALLIDHFMAAFASELGAQGVRLSEEARARLVAYTWPGNVRELQHVVRQILVLGRNAVIDVADLPVELREPMPRVVDEPARSLPDG